MYLICNSIFAQSNDKAIYHNIEFAYSIKYPSDWTLEEYPENESISIYNSKQNSSVQEHLQISVALWEDGNLAEFINTINPYGLEGMYEEFSIKKVFQEETKCMFELSYLLNDVKVNSIFYFQKEEDSVYIFLAMIQDDDNYELDKTNFIDIIESIEFQ